LPPVPEDESFLICTSSSLLITISIGRSGCLLALSTVGRLITLGVISGAVTMKMISSTSMTSMKGTMLISFIVRRPRPRGAPPGISVTRRALRPQVALQDVGDLLDEGFQLDGYAVDVAGEAVV